MRVVAVYPPSIQAGIDVDKDTGHIYWTEMGISNKEDGSIERVNIDGNNHVTIVRTEDLHLKRNGRLCWCDRERMRVMRSGPDRVAYAG